MCSARDRRGGRSRSAPRTAGPPAPGAVAGYRVVPPGRAALTVPAPPHGHLGPVTGRVPLPEAAGQCLGDVIAASVRTCAPKGAKPRLTRAPHPCTTRAPGPRAGRAGPPRAAVRAPRAVTGRGRPGPATPGPPTGLGSSNRGRTRRAATCAPSATSHARPRRVRPRPRRPATDNSASAPVGPPRPRSRPTARRSRVTSRRACAAGEVRLAPCPAAYAARAFRQVVIRASLARSRSGRPIIFPGYHLPGFGLVGAHGPGLTLTRREAGRWGT